MAAAEVESAVAAGSNFTGMQAEDSAAKDEAIAIIQGKLRDERRRNQELTRQLKSKLAKSSSQQRRMQTSAHRIRELVMQLHQKDQALVKTMKRLDVVISTPAKTPAVPVPRLDITAPPGVRGDGRKLSATTSELKDEEASIRHRVGIVASLSRNYEAILEAIRHREGRRAALKEKLYEIETQWNELDPEKTDSKSLTRYSTKVAILAGEIHHENSLLDEIRSKVDALKDNIAAKQEELRRQINEFQSRMRERQPAMTPSVLRAARTEPSPLLLLLDSIPRSSPHRGPEESIETIKERADSILEAVLKDSRLYQILESRRPYLDSLARFIRTPELLEGLALDPTAVNVEHLKADSVTAGGDPGEVLSELVSLAAAWIGSSEGTYRIHIQDCTLSTTQWQKLADSFIAAHEVQELGIIRSEMNPDILKHLLRAIRRSCFEAIDLGYNSLGAEGMELLFLSLTSPFSSAHDAPLSQFGSTYYSSSVRDASSSRIPESDRTGKASVVDEAEQAASLAELPKAKRFSIGDDEENEADPDAPRKEVTISAPEMTQIGTPASHANVARSTLTSLHSKSYPTVCQTLTDLALPVNQLRDEGARTLARLLKMRALPNLSRLDIRWNEIGVEGAAAFASAFQTMATESISRSDGTSPSPLRMVNFGGNRVQESGAASMVTALALSPVTIVDTLDLSMNQVGNEILASLLNLVSNAETFKHLEGTTIALEWNEVDDGDGLLRLASAMASKPPLADQPSFASQTSDAPQATAAPQPGGLMRTTLSPREPGDDSRSAAESEPMHILSRDDDEDASRRVEGWATRDFEYFKVTPPQTQDDNRNRLDFRSQMFYVEEEEGSEGGDTTQARATTDDTSNDFALAGAVKVRVVEASPLNREEREDIRSEVRAYNAKASCMFSLRNNDLADVDAAEIYSTTHGRLLA